MSSSPSALGFAAGGSSPTTRRIHSKAATATVRMGDLSLASMQQVFRAHALELWTEAERRRRALA